MSTDINNMLKEKGETCISIIIPTHRFTPERQGDQVEVEQSVFSAKQAVQNKSIKLSNVIDELVQKIDYNHNKEGIGLFVSPSIKKLVKFPFPVTKRVMINKIFYLQDLLYIDNYEEIDYYLLDLSKKEIHLFHGVMDNLEEIKENNLPRKIVEEYEYNKPSQSTSYAGYAHEKGFEKDKSILRQIRLQKVFQEVDKSLSKYLVTKDIPLILCGPKNDIALYKSVSGYMDNVAVTMNDNFQKSGAHDLEVLAWQKMRPFIDKQKLKLVTEFKEKIGEKLGVYGIEEVWNAAKEGRGFKLLVENNYTRQAFVNKDNKLYLHPPKEMHTEIPDVINEIISMVLQKNGNVVIVEKNTLKDFERIALINRY